MKRVLPLATSAYGYPIEQNNAVGPAGLDHLQLALQDSIAAIVQQMTGQTNNVILFGGASVTITGGNYSTTAGWVWYRGDSANVGELFFLPTISSTSMGGKSYLNASVDATVSGADPTTYSDGVTTLSPHVNRRIALIPANSPSSGAYALPAGAQAASLPYSLITTLPDATLWGRWIDVNSGVGFQNGFVNLGTPNANVRFTKENNYVVLAGAVNNAGPAASNSTVFTLPAGYTPTYRQRFIISPNSNTVFGTIEVETNGNVILDFSSGPGQFWLDGIRIALD